MAGCPQSSAGHTPVGTPWPDVCRSPSPQHGGLQGLTHVHSVTSGLGKTTTVTSLNCQVVLFSDDQTDLKIMAVLVLLGRGLYSQVVPILTWLQILVSLYVFKQSYT